MGCGAQSVMTDGTPEMLKFSVDSWDSMDVSFNNVSFTMQCTCSFSCLLHPKWSYYYSSFKIM